MLDRLLGAGHVDEAAVQRARRHCTTPAPDGEILSVLTKLGLVTEEDVVTACADALQMPDCPADALPEAPLLERDRVSLRFLADVKAVPVAADETGITLALANPVNPFPARAVTWATGLPVRALVARASDLDAALSRYLDAGPAAGEGEAETPADSQDADRLRDLASEAPVIRYVNRLLGEASDAGASDIHIEPAETGLRVRQRVDGVLQTVDAPPPNLTAAVISRIKLIAHLDIAERRLPQDGRARFVVRGRSIDLRIATLPMLDRESVVIRLLDRGQVVLDFPALGFEPDHVETLSALLRRPNGILLVTGPTGSGKTTTLYTALKAINDPAKKIITVEDPVEYQLAGVNQVQVKPKIGLDFATVLRSMLRQDPDVLMVGEVRDLETAQIAIQAALTGHLVLSTLHTNSAADTLTRLRDMGLEPYLLGSTILGVVAQRLVRRLCPDCRVAVERDGAAIARELGTDHPLPDRVTVYEPAVGGSCESCGGRGYRGRMVIYEIMGLGPALRDAVAAGAGGAELQRIARAEGMRTMVETGLVKALAGATSLEEVFRAAQEA
ncbi:MAG: GspE/PulE family protein [Alphaproteobacteria bacterium]